MTSCSSRSSPSSLGSSVDRDAQGLTRRSPPARVAVDHDALDPHVASRPAGSEPGSPVRIRSIASSARTPITESCGPVIPASVIAAVPPGRTRASFVWTWVCVPITAVTRPSRMRASATFSLVASAWKSTTRRACVARASSTSSSTIGERMTRTFRKSAPWRFTTATGGPSVGLDDGNARGRARRGPPRFAGRMTRGLRSSTSKRSRRRQTWFPVVMHVGARGEELVGELRGQAGAVGRVLAVHDAEIGAELLVGASGRRASTARRPAGPKTSARKRIFMGESGSASSYIRCAHRTPPGSGSRGGTHFEPRQEVLEREARERLHHEVGLVERESAVIGFGTATVKIPAAFAARTPFSESSNATASAAVEPSVVERFEVEEGAGLARSTSPFAQTTAGPDVLDCRGGSDVTPNPGSLALETIAPEDHAPPRPRGTRRRPSRSSSTPESSSSRARRCSTSVSRSSRRALRRS